MGRSYGFERTRKGLVVHLDADERRLVSSIAQQVVDLVATPPAPADEDPLVAMVGIDVSAQRSDDPAVARLFPDAYSDDDEAALEFRRFTERDLRAGKVHNARVVIESCGRSSGMLMLITDESAMSWLGFLNDARLTIGTRLGITDDSRDEFDQMDNSDPRFAMAQIYDWLTYLQDSLITSLSRE
jgi:hypothetical protein